jgi:hypothetical protein
MLVFPQLNSGALVQTSFRRTSETRTEANRLADGSEVRGPDDSAAAVSWEVALCELSDVELNGISTLFDAVEGRVGTFVFLDPAGNLLQWSEDLSRNCWQKGAMLQLLPGIADPFGGTGAVRVTNAGQSAQDVSQGLAAPATFFYCLSVYARTAAAGSVSLFVQAGQSRQIAAFDLSPAWRRCSLAWNGGIGVDRVNFGVELAPGASVEFYGFQAQAQPVASSYRRTLDASGVYSAARFDADEFRAVSDAPGRHSSSLRIVSRR